MSSNDIRFSSPAILCLALGILASVISLAGASASNPVQEGEMAGYLLVPTLLDSRPSEPNRALQMETQYVPAVQAVDGKGETYARIARTFFPRGPGNNSVVMHRITSYTRQALWDAVKAWFEGGNPASGAIDPQQACVHGFTNRGGATWRSYTPAVPEKQRVALAWNSFATPMALDTNTFGYHWNYGPVTKDDSRPGPLAVLPEYYHLVTNRTQKAEWVPVRAEEVPVGTGLEAGYVPIVTRQAAKE